MKTKKLTTYQKEILYCLVNRENYITVDHSEYPLLVMLNYNDNITQIRTKTFELLHTLNLISGLQMSLTPEIWVYKITGKGKKAAIDGKVDVP